ncbi:hypothetical protein HYH02_009046 [Chlamydomonas schloesseri]|uniref:Uncharacterized protein n=1 Tax=Chlamydomonas schloesseri TaxID=2026947 RepID=A0A835WB20_9CHLO|nr:hypothetical protein HYH02_009046 [Chlamydomonas schloesseri]|eukprot:KAG2444104.1 hypothetical protein HYH02_009046 [Chlamydomonas schloesseri]
MCKAPYEYILFDCVLKSFRTEYVDEAAERRARAAPGGGPGGGASLLSAAHRRRRALYVSQGPGATNPAGGAAAAAAGASGVASSEVVEPRTVQPTAVAAAASQGGRPAGVTAPAMSTQGRGAIRRGADDPELKAFVKRELQAVLLQEDVTLVAQHVLGVLRAVLGGPNSVASGGGGGSSVPWRGAQPVRALAPGRNRYVPPPKRPRGAATAQGPAASVQDIETALSREAACFLHDDVQQFARQVGLFLTSGLSVKAFDDLVFGAAEEHAQGGGPIDGAHGSTAGATRVDGVEGADGGAAGSRSQKRRASNDVIGFAEESDGGGDDFGYEEYSDEG